MSDFLHKAYHSSILGSIFHTTKDCIQKTLSDCDSVLDLGCGPDSPIQNCSGIRHSVGVEIFSSYLEQAKQQKTHSQFIRKDIFDVDFEEDSFDAVVLIEVIEHLPKNKGLEILRRAKIWARKKVIVTTPNGFVRQKSLDDNPYQEHLSGWTIEEMKRNGFSCKGLAGFKFLRQEVQSETMIGENFLTSICWHPKLFWFAVATLSQLLVYHKAKWAFELFCVQENL